MARFDEPIDSDPCFRFLAAWLPLLNNSLFGESPAPEKSL